MHQVDVLQKEREKTRTYMYMHVHSSSRTHAVHHETTSLQLFKTSGEGRKGTDQSKHSQHFRALLLRRCGCGLAYNRIWVWFRAHAHKNYTN